MLGRKTRLSDIRHKRPRKYRTEDTQRAGDKEGILTRSGLIRSIMLRNRQNVSPHKSAYLAHCGSYAIVLTPDRGRAGLRRQQSDVISRAEFAKREEDPERN